MYEMLHKLYMKDKANWCYDIGIVYKMITR